ncbi:ATP-binding protein [Chitinibacter sp. FCG-7]|uniref:histidine kinase n=1 Tax=Chitinibacter mangrovi TaxID=3153927 RepID=A0AAU7F830_9NEIS
MQVTKQSLQRQILLWTVLPLLALWSAGAAVIYLASFQFANESNDAALMRLGRVIAQQISQSLQAAQSAPDKQQSLDPAVLTAQSRQLFAAVADENVHLAVQVGGELILGQPLRAFASEVSESAATIHEVHEVKVAQEPHRVLHIQQLASRNLPAIQIEIAKDTAAQSQAFQRYLLNMALPLVPMLLLVSVLVWFGVRHSLKPLRTLKLLVETRQAQDLSPLSLDNAPEELNALSSALNQLLASTEESMNRQRRFIADAAHQLRTPLAGLKSQTELAMRENSPEGLRDRLNMVHTSATRSIHLVNQLLTLARSEPGSLNGIPKVKMDLARLIRDLTGELVPRALAARIDLGCDCLVSEAWIEGNSALLRELFINLVENAIKYIPRDGSVTVRLTENEQQYLVDVEDNGAGIPDADKQRVFERFFRREQTGNGCGLGMAIVREIVERHSGKVELKDAVPHGLIVHVVLPKNLATV